MDTGINRPDQFYFNKDWKKDLSGIVERIKTDNPVLLECPEMINFIGTQLQLRLSFSSMSTLIERISVDPDHLIAENLIALYAVYAENPLCRIAFDFLDRHMYEIMQLTIHPENVEEIFQEFELEYAETPLQPFFKEIKEAFYDCSDITEENQFQTTFENTVHYLMVRSLTKRQRENTLHQSDGYCHGAFIALASPIKGMSAAFAHVPYSLYRFFQFSFNRQTTSVFGNKFCATELNKLQEDFPVTCKVIKEFQRSCQIHNEPYYHELIGRIAVGHFFGRPDDLVERNEGLNIHCNLDKPRPHLASLKIVGKYILEHLIEFKSVMPQDPPPSMEAWGEWAYHFYQNKKNVDNHYKIWLTLITLFSDVDKMIGSSDINRRGLELESVTYFRQPFKNPYFFTYSLMRVNMQEGEHYDLSIRLTKTGSHAFYLGKKDGIFNFADPNFYDPQTFQPYMRSFANQRECVVFIHLYIWNHYSKVITFTTFDLIKYTEIVENTSQIKEYQYGKSITKRSHYLNEGMKWTRCQKELKDRLSHMKEGEEFKKIENNIAIIEKYLERLKHELMMFPVINKEYLEEKLAQYTHKLDTTQNKSYALVIESLKELLKPVELTPNLEETPSS